MPGTSTIHHAFNLHCLLENMKFNGKTLFCAFLDMSRAYDRVWREGMFIKLAKCGIPGKFFDILRSMYNETKAHIKHLNMISDTFICNTGIK